MIPDTIAGGVLLSVVNMAVVFLVLGFLAVLIGFIAKMVKGKDSSGKEEASSDSLLGEADGPTVDQLPSQESSPGGQLGFSESCESAAFHAQPQSIDPKIKAAISAAVSFVLSGGVGKPVFVRKITDSGVWGKSFRNYPPRGLNQ